MERSLAINLKSDKKLKVFWLGVFLATILTVALGQPDRPFVFGALSYFFGYSGAFCLLLRYERKKRFLYAFLWYAGVQLYQLAWLATTHYHGFVIFFLYFLVISVFAIQFSFLSLFLSDEKELGIRRALAIASLWVLLEWSRLYMVCGFPFNTVGLVMGFSIYPLQWASLFGVYGLSFWVIFTASIGVIALKERSLGYLSLWIVLLIVPCVFGAFQLGIHEKSSQSRKKLNVALVQTGLTEEQKWSFPEKENHYVRPLEQWQRIFAYLEKHEGEKIDLIVLPEVAVPGEAYLHNIPLQLALDQVLHKKERLPPLAPPLAVKGRDERWFVNNAYMAQALSNLYKSEVVIGLLDHSEEKDEHYNAAFHFMPFRHVGTRYDKRVLVPLSEYMPFAFFRSFIEKYGITTFFVHGKEAKIFQGIIPLAASVCYEEGYSGLIREGRIRGAEVFVNVTNDGWFPFSRLPQEHFNLGRLRAVENGVPVLRACNTGITSAVDSFGRVIASMEEIDQKGEFAKGALFAKVSLYHWMPPFARFGNLLILSLSLLSLIVFAFSQSLYNAKPQK